MRTDWNSVSLDSLGVLRVRGADVVSFLQGQLSNDVALLSAERSLLAGYHNPQGRVIALLRLLQPSPGEVLAILPRELAAAVALRLTKFILRTKVKVADESASWRVVGLIAPESPANPAPLLANRLPETLDGSAPVHESIAVRVGALPARWLILSSLAPAASAAHPPAALSDWVLTELDTWQRLAVAAGEPEVYAATSEEFVAQMLNLDVLGAIAFDKGCYTGQEVIARAHYRGRVKRRLQRFVTHTPLRLKPGDAGELADGRAFKVVNAVPLADGGCEFLAVALVSADDSNASRSPREAQRGAMAINAEPLALPYPLPP
ncbi:MAG TPA: hypothetical protein VGD47_11870 [Steroidobacteraceae bacterium]